MSTELPLARGVLEDVVVDAGRLHVGGWMALPGQEIDSYSASFAGGPAEPLDATDRPDVATVIPGVATGRHAGFRGSLALSDVASEEWHELRVVGLSGDRPVAEVTLELPLAFREWPTPPAPLMVRVAHLDQPALFKLDGLRSLRDLLYAARRHVDLDDVEAILDWGCGCGRKTLPLTKRLPGREIQGCDVDRDAVDWCAGNVDGARFAVIPTRPPTQYPSSSFDLILGDSIFTHLERDAQLAWLSECSRLLRPGGVLVATVQGERALELVADETTRAETLQHGVCDRLVDDTLAGVLAEGSYRAVFQTEDWTRRVWSRAMRVLDVHPAAAGGFHDVVVLTSSTGGSRSASRSGPRRH
ncbi:MAG: class I SAM-dependent methyltransferase [Planctomycetota bacterium]